MAAFIGFWDAAAAGNFSGMFPNGGASACMFSAPTSTSTLLARGSSYSANGESAVVFPTAGSVLPTGLTGGTIYYVKSPSSDSFQLSATNGGSAITLTGDGSGIVQAITAEAYVGAGTFPVSSRLGQPHVSHAHTLNRTASARIRSS